MIGLGLFPSYCVARTSRQPSDSEIRHLDEQLLQLFDDVTLDFVITAAGCRVVRYRLRPILSDLAAF